MPPSHVAYDAIVLAGGTSERFGADKLLARVGGQTMLDRGLAAVADAGRRVVVGPVRPVASPVLWVREEPAGSGPAAGIVAALPEVRAPRLLLLAGDTPYVTAATVARLLAALPGWDAARLVDRDGRAQHLISAVATGALRAAAATRPSWAHVAVRELLRPLEVADVPTVGAEATDVNTRADLAAAESRLSAAKGATMTLPAWIAAVQAELGTDLAVDSRLLLEVAREVAHGVDRPAAPLTTFLVGYAAGLHGGEAPSVQAAAQQVRRLLADWAPPQP